VRDTGPGIAPEIGERVFEPYFTTKQHGEGTGLGLAVVHGIVTSLGGTVTYSSRPGEGTVFRVLLPQIQRASTEMINKEGKAPSGSEHILVVDDEASIASLVANMLVSLGYKVTTHTSSREALSDFRAQPQVYDLILTDQTMPEMTGEQLARELLQGQHDPPIILCTGFSQTITAKHAAELGISAYIQKPVTRRSLAKTVRQVLDEHKPSGS